MSIPQARILISHLSGARILITGGTGFLGSRLTSLIGTYPVEAIIVPSRTHGNYSPDRTQYVGPYDLTIVEDIRQLLRIHRPDVVIHLAANVGGIGANRDMPGDFFYNNMAMGLNLIHESMKAGVEKFIQIGTVCSFPKFTKCPFQIEDLWNGFPEETNAPYGIAKKALLTMLMAYQQQYSFRSVYLIPTNLYGPRDNFDLNTSHVIPALIRKCFEAKALNKDSVEIWGTGEATREFLYVDDCANAIIKSIGLPDIGPFCIGSGEEIKIRDLVDLIANLIGYEGDFVYNNLKPDGQPRRNVDSSNFREVAGWSSEVSLEQGLRDTISWYETAGDDR